MSYVPDDEKYWIKQSLNTVLRALKQQHPDPRLNMSPEDIKRCTRMKTLEQLQKRLKA